MSTKTFTCDFCHEEHPIDDLYTFDGQSLCPDCFESETILCDHCGERVWEENSVQDEHISLCLCCYENYYTHCSQCDRLIHCNDAHYLDDDDEPYCSHCAEQHNTRRIQSYYYKPEPVFHGEGSRFLGVELEIDYAGEDNDTADRLMRIANRNGNHLYIKHDGSLENGMELVTHPMTLKYHQNEMPWKSVMDAAVKLGYRSHQTGTCGLHVHVNRTSLGKTAARQEETIARILFFVENHWNELLRFSRRTQAQMEHWAARYGRKDSPKEQMEHAKSRYMGRYVCINLLNSDTIEFRLFRGTLRYNTLIATLQLVNEICSVALLYSGEEMAELTWSEFVGQLGNVPELVQYLKERRLYVNDSVSGEEEV